MSILKKVLIFCFGIPFGIYIAFYLVVAGSNRTVFGRVTGFIETPFLWIAQSLYPAGSGQASGCFMILHLCFWGLLGGLLFLGVAVLLSKVTGDA
jgi:hypothetical protein